MLSKYKLNQLYFKDTQFANLMTRRIFNVLMTDALTKRYSMNILLYHFVIRPVSRRYPQRRRHWRNWKICLSIW